MKAKVARGPHRSYSAGDLIQNVVSSHARLAPDAPALIAGDRTVTYGTLDAVSDELAVRLSSTRIKCGDIVPVLLPRSPELVAILLAILKCGAAYTAFDPDWPRPRIDSLIRKINAPIVITTKALAASIPDAWSLEESSLTQVPISGRKPSPLPINGNSPASVFFTSGTTGEPKGVLSPHRGAIRLFEDCEFASFDSRSVMPLVAPLPWDGLTLELWGALLSGGTSVIVDAPSILPHNLRALISNHGLNIVWLTSSLFNLFVEEDIGCFVGLNDVLVGGEKLSTTHVRKFLDSHPSINLTNGYGPAESTVFATTHRIESHDCDTKEGIPLGKPVANTSIYVLDGFTQCRSDEVGELCVSGDGLAIGYMNDEELTRRHFETVDLDGSPVRLYRTGDLAHISTEGVLYFHGRADRQVKIRGRRIEPAEIEQAVLSLDNVSQAAVLAVPGPDGAFDHLVLFVVPHDCTLDAGSIEIALHERLPTYLVPAKTRLVPQLPLTANGKLDRQALLALVDNRVERSVAATRDECSETHALALIVRIFADILGDVEVPSDVSFTTLGGSSLAVARLCARLSSTFDTEISVAEVMEHSSADELASWIENPLRAGSKPSRAEEDPRSTTAPLIAMQMGFVHAQMFDPDDVSGICSMVWHIDGLVDAHAMEAAFADVVVRHEALRSRVEIGADTIHLRTNELGAVEFRHLDVTTDPAEQIDQRVREALHRPIDPLEGPVCRAVFASVGESRSMLGVAVLHIAFDGWSEHILADDLSFAYRARSRGRKPNFVSPAPGISQVAKHYINAFASGDTERKHRFWQTALAKVPEIQLGRAQVATNAASGDTTTLEFDLTTSLVDTWRRISSNSDTTFFATMLSVYAEALSLSTGQRNFGIGVPVAKRDTPVLASAVNCLINTICVAIDMNDLPDWRSTLARVHCTSSAAFEAQDIPFHEIVAMLGPFNTQRNPLFQTIFAFQDNVQPDLELDDCSTQFYRPNPPGGICELLVEFTPRRDGSAYVQIVYQTRMVSQELAHKLGDIYKHLLQDGIARLREIDHCFD